MIPRATYRLQLNGTFTFRAATELIPYLARLGVSHVYCSPYFRARPGSAHGYDVVDHNVFNPEIGDRNDFEHFVATLRTHGMGHIVDLVPNHVGVMGADNAWWLDVLENGPSSRYAEYFDIDWQPANPALTGKLLVPALGEPYGIILEKGELDVRFDAQAGSFAVFYHEHRLPLDPHSYQRLLERAVPQLAPDTDVRAELESLMAAFRHLPQRDDLGADSLAERNRDKELCKRRLAELCTRDASAAVAIEAAVHSFRGTPGDRASFDSLHELLDSQAYRLAYWRVAGDEINYRRFFDVNDLAALRMENEAVFAATHRLVVELVHSGLVDGLRVDHPDGLYDPRLYLERLRQATGSRDAGREPLYLVVEKITAGFEHLPDDWPVHGTTGYRFANVVNGLYVDSAAKGRIGRTYRAFTGDSVPWPAAAYEGKQLTLATSLAAELNVLANQLQRIARADRRTRDFTLASLRGALGEMIACFPVYRTYITGREGDTVSVEDRRYIDWAATAARRHPRFATDSAVFDFVRTALLVETPVANELVHLELRAFAMKFQQVTAPVTAKGMEDTASYRFNRLVSLNEVGGDPDSFGAGVRTFHSDCRYRARHWPHEMLATSTHDTKRSEDVRARIDVLSEMPQLWRASLVKWRRMNRSRKSEIDGRMVPTAGDEYLLYQTLLGTWPLDGGAAGTLPDVATYRERIVAYMTKAVREAKFNSSWANVDAAYEAALGQFIGAILEPSEGNAFAADLGAMARRLASVGFLNGLGQTLCKLTAPGVPDIYQGNEIWDFSLVDPDNRRAVDYERRSRMLAQLEAAQPSGTDGAALPEMLAKLADGRCKLYVIWKVLALRRQQAELFSRGQYLPLRTAGAHAHHLCAYARRLGSRFALTIVPRLSARLLGERAGLPLGADIWEDTTIELPPKFAAERLYNVLDGNSVASCESAGSSVVTAAAALAAFPVALLVPLSDNRAPAE